MDILKPLLSGAIIMGSWSIALFFFRFLKQTRDALFGYFAVAFFLFGVERIVVFWKSSTEPHSYVYLIRLLAFVLIVIGIIQKNKVDKRRG